MRSENVHRATSLPARMNVPAGTQDVLKRYGFALLLAGFALLLRAALPVKEGTTIYQLPVAAVVLSAWYGGRGPGALASLVSAMGVLYFFVPPRYSFVLSPEYALAFFIFVVLCVFLTEFGAGRRRTEDALRASEERYRTFLYVAADALMIHTEDGTVVDVNRQACESLGYTRQELIGMKPADFDAGLDNTQLRRVIEQVEAGEVMTFETQWRRKDGTIFPVEVRGRQFRHGARWLGISISRDITERKHAEAELRASEERFRTLVEHATDAFYLRDEQLRMIDVNEAACQMLGYSREELLRMQASDFDVGLDEASIEQVRKRFLAGQTVTFKTLHRRRDGTVFPVEVRGRGFEQRGRRLFLALVRDITERKLVEQTLREKDHALQLARTEHARVSRLTTLGELTTSIAHEVSQPLGAMVASAGACARWLTADPPAFAEARATLDNIVADGKRAREVIARIRALTKRQAPRQDRLDINQQIVEVLALTEHQLRSHDVVLRTDLCRTLAHVAGDRVQLQQVLLNLIVNAIEAMSAVRDRSRELTIVSRQDDSDAVLVEVRDSGTGLDAQHAEQVFDAFYTTKAEGLGIGLSISRSIAESREGGLPGRRHANARHDGTRAL